jgi:hypothetical protein
MIDASLVVVRLAENHTAIKICYRVFVLNYKLPVLENCCKLELLLVLELRFACASKKNAFRGAYLQ